MTFNLAEMALVAGIIFVAGACVGRLLVLAWARRCVRADDNKPPDSGGQEWWGRGA